ncbi:MAG: Ig-like domain-containing protein [Saprospiraceae bacterium]|nr:Ig-like domain-containing protein [Saprospiraceae bacterium]
MKQASINHLFNYSILPFLLWIGTAISIQAQTPNVNCQNIIVSLDALGTATITATDLDNGSTNVSQFYLNSIGTSSVSFNCANIGINSVMLIGEHINGNLDTCTAIVTIEDISAPVATCNNITVPLSNVGITVVNPIELNDASSDNCSIANYLINGQPQDTFDCGDIGVQTTSLTVMDNSGNQSSCTSTVTVIDTTNPTAVCQNYDAYLDATGNVTVLPTSINGSSADACGIAMLQINNASSHNYTNADLGTQTATLSVTDVSGNVSNCLAQINVLGSGLVSNITVQGQGGATSVSLGNTLQMLATITPLNAAIQDVTWTVSNTSIATIDPITGLLTGLSTGSVVVTATATDGSGISADIVISVGTSNSTINAICQNYTATLDTSGVVNILPTDIDNGSTANAGIAQLLINGQSNVIYTCANVGTNATILTIVDNNGTTDLCSSVVTVEDNISPVAICQSNYNAYLDPSGLVTVVATDIDNGSSDNCGTVNMLIGGGSSLTFTTADIGSLPVILEVFDVSGNTSNCPSIINVIDTNALVCSAVDTINPVAICQNISAPLDAMGSANIIAADLDNGSYDNCGIMSTNINGVGSVSFNCSDLGGTYPLTLMVVDSAGNTNTCTANVAIYDPQSPSLVCNANATFHLDASGTASVNPSDLSSATDACGIAAWTIDGLANKTFDCSHLLNTHTVQLQVIDLGGNSSTCQSVLTILDTASICSLQGIVDSIHAIPCDSPTCVGAIELSALGGTAPYTFLWNDGSTNSVNTSLCPGYYSVTITDDNGSTATVDSILVPYTQGCVWPGDTDDNTVANNFDLLGIALAFGDIGSVRPNATTNWEGQSAPDWNINLSGLPDHKHIDTDGDGTIGINDVNAILLNYGQSYFRSGNSSSNSPNAVPFWPRDLTAYEGQRIGVPINLGSTVSPATDIYGVAFTLSYDPALINASTVDVDFDNSWLGTDLLTLEKNFETKGNIDVALARKDRQNISGYGQIATVFITIHDEVLRSRASSQVDMPMIISNIRLIDADNNEIPVNSLIGTLSITADTSTSSITLKEEKPKVVVYPNPTKDQLFLQAQKTQIRSLSLYNTLGQLITSIQQPSSSLVNLDVSAYEAGVYLLRIETDKGLLTERIIIE